MADSAHAIGLAFAGSRCAYDVHKGTRGRTCSKAFTGRSPQFERLPLLTYFRFGDGTDSRKIQKDFTSR